MSSEDFSDPVVAAGMIVHQAATAISILDKMPAAIVSQNLRGLEEIEEELCALITRTFNATRDE